MKRSIFVAASLLTFSSIMLQPEQKTIVFTQEFKLKIGESAEARSEGVKIEFDSVPEDSRCPKGVSCVWAGNAKILLKVHKDADRQTNVELNTNINPRTARYFDYEVGVKELKPYPEANGTIKSSDYEVTLTVHKL